MENKNYIPAAPLYDSADNHGTQLNRTSSVIRQRDDDNLRYHESEFGDYSCLSGPSSRSNKKSTASAQIYNAPHEVLNRRSDDTRANATKSPQCTVGKVLHVALQVVMLLLLVSILVMLLYSVSKNSCTACTSDTSGSINAGFTGNSNINSSLTFLQNKIDHILEHFVSTNNSSLLLQNAKDSVLSHIAVHDNSTNKYSAEILQLLNVSLVKDIPTTAAINDILVIVNELLEIQNGTSLFNYVKPVSCKNIKAVQPSSPTGYYHVNSRNIYCNMDGLCGEEGGWTRIAYLDTSDHTHRCPSGLRYSNFAGACGLPRGSTSGTCWSSAFQTNGINYTQICGRVFGYQKGTTNGIRSNTSIDSPYLDGVSITRGSPREHVWSYIAGLNSNVTTSCPCSNGSNANVPSFVENNYYCESGSPGVPHYNYFYGENQLWDGDQCSDIESDCCISKLNNISLPWFYRDYGNATSTDYLELRICCDQQWKNEDVLVRLYEIYVK